MRCRRCFERSSDPKNNRLLLNNKLMTMGARLLTSPKHLRCSIRKMSTLLTGIRRGPMILRHLLTNLPNFRASRMPNLAISLAVRLKFKIFSGHLTLRLQSPGSTRGLTFLGILMFLIKLIVTGIFGVIFG